MAFGCGAAGDSLVGAGSASAAFVGVGSGGMSDRIASIASAAAMPMSCSQCCLEYVTERRVNNGLASSAKPVIVAVIARFVRVIATSSRRSVSTIVG